MPEFDLSDPRGFIRDTIRVDDEIAEKLESIADLQQEVAKLTVESNHRKALLLKSLERLGEGKLYDISTYHGGSESRWSVGAIDGALKILPRLNSYQIPDALLTAVETPEIEDDLTEDDVFDLGLVVLAGNGDA